MVCHVRRILLLLSVIGVIASLATPGKAQISTGTVEVSVRGADPLADGVKVFVTSDLVGSYEGVRELDESGHASIPGVPSGALVRVVVKDASLAALGEGSGFLDPQAGRLSIQINLSP